MPETPPSTPRKQRQTVTESDEIFNSPFKSRVPSLKKPSHPPTPESMKSNKVVKLNLKNDRIRNIGKLLLNEKTILEPSTPKSKLITDEMVKEWNKSDEYTDSEEEEEIISTKLDNPFISNEPNSFHRMDSTVDYSKYNEYIDKNGKKFIKRLTTSEQNIKPKRLFTKELDLGLKKKNDFEIFKD